MAYRFGKRSLDRMDGVHPLLRECAERALSYGIMDLTVPEYGGLRTLDDQRTLVARGASQTLNSLHRKQSSGYGHAIDLVPYPVDWKNIQRFAVASSLMFRAAMEMGGIDVIPLRWGGHWKSFRDFPHFDLGRGFTG